MLKKSSYRTLLSSFVAMSTVGLGSSALVGCSSEDEPEVCLSDDSQWQFPDCSNTSAPIYIGTPGAPCTTPDGLWTYDSCLDNTTAQYHGECTSDDGNWKFTKCSDPNTAVWQGAGPAPAGGAPTGLAPTLPPPVNTGTVAPVDTTVAPVNPTGVTPATTDTTVAPVAPATSDTTVAPVAPDTTTVAPDTTTVTPDTSTADPVAPDPVDPGPAAPVDAANRTCPAYEGLIADFEEEGDNALRLVEAEGRVGLIDVNNDGSAEQLLEVVAEGTEACNSKVLHTSGSGFAAGAWSGIETVLSGTWDEAEAGYTPNPYDATALGYVGVSFRAKKGASQVNPVKLSLSVPGTREVANGGDGTCDPDDATAGCWNHLGHFLIDDEELGTDWQTFTFCFDRDLHPMFLPNHLSPEQRARAGTELMTLGFEFNKGKEENGDDNDPGDAFDFYLDDVKFVKSCPDKALFQSTDGAALPFPQNKPIGNCTLVSNVERFNSQISEAYLRWKDNFVRSASPGLQVWSNEDNRSISESIGYGMLIAAAMGDKAVFDGLNTYWKSQSQGGSSLMRWVEGGDGTATDADTDAAYGLMLANAQWGGYDATPLANDVIAMDFGGSTINAGSNWADDIFNPSYFSPSFYRAFESLGSAGTWMTATSSGYDLLNSCSTLGGALPPDWCRGGTPAEADSVGAAVTSISGVVYAFDAARTPWRIGLDSCVTNGDATAKAYVTKLVNFFEGKYPGRIDLMKAGFTSSGDEHADAEDTQMSFIGPMGVAAMAAGDSAMYERALLTVLDIMERPEFYETYYPATVGMLSLLAMTGNFPHL